MWRRSAFLLALLAGCDQPMRDQPRFEPQEASTFFPDGRAARPRVEGTVARGQLRTDTHLHTGKLDGRFAETFPFAITRDDLARGRERYAIFCTPCHDAAGSGNGMVVQRGFRRPVSLHEDRLRAMPVGQLVDVINAGFGSMPAYGRTVPAEDQWRIVAYIRALQLSSRIDVKELPEADRSKLP